MLKELTQCTMNCKQFLICKSGCIKPKIITNYTENNDKILTLKKCINSRYFKCMR